MRRIALLFLSFLMLVGCLSAVDPVALADDASPAPLSEPAEPPEERVAPQASAPFLSYRFFDQPNWGDLTSAVMFEADLDQDGAAEPVSFTKDEEEDTTAITWGQSTALLEEGAEFVEAEVLDLDPASPFYNLLVVIDYGSDSYVTIELHPENGQLTKGNSVQGSWDWTNDALWFYEQTNFLGTAFGKRTYSGDGLTPDSEWLTMCEIPTAEELEAEEDRAFLIDGGTLLHTILPVPCTVDGQPSLIDADTYLYRLRFRNEDDLTEVALPDGTVAQIACTLGEDGWPYLIAGVEMEKYFDNLFFAD